MHKLLDNGRRAWQSLDLDLDADSGSEGVVVEDTSFGVAGSTN
jgi:hypothetical protein